MNRFILITAAIVGFSGCSLTWEDWAEEFPNAYCAWAFKCCSADERPSSLTSEADCVANKRAEADSWLQNGAPENYSGSSAYTIIHGNLTNCDPKTSWDIFGIYEQGSKDPGEGCGESLECASLNCVGRVCAKRGTAPNDPCNSETESKGLSPCDPPMFCYTDPKEPYCRNKYEDGEACSLDYECKSGVCAEIAKECVTLSGHECDGV